MMDEEGGREDDGGRRTERRNMGVSKEESRVESSRGE